MVALLFRSSGERILKISITSDDKGSAQFPPFHKRCVGGFKCHASSTHINGHFNIFNYMQEGYAFKGPGTLAFAGGRKRRRRTAILAWMEKNRSEMRSCMFEKEPDADQGRDFLRLT